MYKYFKFLFLIISGVLLFSCATFSQKDDSPPEVTFIQNYAYISPNGDGIQDELTLDVGIKDKSAISYWKLAIYDEKGNLIKQFESAEKLLDQQKKLVLPNKSISYPRRLTWNGKDEKGNIVPDGKYNYVFISMDNKKNLSSKDKNTGIINVDTDKPEIKTEISDKIFSPNNDSSKDILKIKVNIIKAATDNIIKKKDEAKSDGTNQIWYIDILDEKDKLIKRYTYEEKGLKNIEWDGKDEQGNLVPDGVYKIKTYSTDLGGNKYEETITNIVKNTVETPVNAILLSDAFSPNNDNIKDKIGFKFDIPVTSGIKEWKFSILNSAGIAVKEFSGQNNPPLNIEWDGKDKTNNLVKEDEYTAQLDVIYENGNMPSSTTGSFIMDITKPYVEITLSSNIFSPDGNGKEDELIIEHNKASQEETKWEGFIYNEKGDVVTNFEWQGQNPPRLVWEGKNNQNILLPDGLYFYQLQCTDRAGNSFISEKYQAKIYTGDIPLFITASLKSFSPNGDGVKDNQIFEIKSSITSENKVSDWKVEIKNNGNDKTVYTTSAKGNIPEKIDWNGKINVKDVAPDGEYKAYLNVNIVGGTESKSESKVFLIDTTPPVFTAAKNIKYFSPDDDGINDELILNLSAKDDSGINKWKVQILSPYRNRVFKEFNGIGEPAKEVKWNGYSSKNELVDSTEDYPIVLYAEDTVGNIFEKEVDSIMIDILVMKLKDGRLKVKVSNIKFKPDKAEMTEDPKNIEVLDLLSNALKKYPQHNIRMEGFANRYAANLSEKVARELSEKRAVTVSEELNNRGINKERMTIVGRGFEDPIIPLKKNMTKEEKAEMERNRRVEFYLQK